MERLQLPAHCPERHRLNLPRVNQNGLGGALSKNSVTGAAFQIAPSPRRDATLFVAEEVRVNVRMRYYTGAVLHIWETKAGRAGRSPRGETSPLRAAISAPVLGPRAGDRTPYRYLPNPGKTIRRDAWVLRHGDVAPVRAGKALPLVRAEGKAVPPLRPLLRAEKDHPPAV